MAGTTVLDTPASLGKVKSLPLLSKPKNEITIESVLAAVEERFTHQNPKSCELHLKAVKSLPGGNTRSLLHTAPFPVFMKSGQGYQLTDEDGHTYTDFVGEMTAGLFGHSHPLIRQTIIETIDKVGLNLGANNAKEAEYASLLCSRFNLNRIRFCNSGTEANMHALVGARHFTKKRKVVVFSGGYHGAVFMFSGGKPASNNVDTDDWIIARYNDIDMAKKCIQMDGVAAVLLEGMQGAGGVIPATKEFLQAVQETAQAVGVLFILDEVMTSRLHPNGLAGKYDLKPDLKTFGKYLGAGMAFGAFGGREDVMAVFDPRAPTALAHSGTFNNNTLVTHAGYAAMSQIYTPDACLELNAQGSWFLDLLHSTTVGTKCFFTGVGTILCVHFSDTGAQPMLRAEDVVEKQDLRDLFWMEMLEQGFWITRRGSIAIILGTPVEELKRFAECVKSFLEKYNSLMRVD